MNYRLRMAGFFGCLSGVPVYNNLNNFSTSTAFNFGQGIVGYEAVGTSPGQGFSPGATNPSNASSAAGWLPALPADLVGSVVPGSDVVIVRNVSPSASALISPYNDSAQVFVGALPSEFLVGEIAIVSDCQKASVFQITNVSTAGPGGGINLTHSSASFVPGNATPNWDDDQQYGPGAELLRAETWIYYVGARPGGGPPALFQRRLQLGGTAVALVADELVEGVETLQILYGIDADGDRAVDQYVTANNVADWAQVVTVRLGVLLRAPDEYGTETDTQVYDVNETLLNPVDDRRLRQLFTTTVAIRNRLP
jgi:type IV pilus assembly protein PilW